MKLKDKRAIITGANQGFGFAIAKAFVSEGASIAICARNKEKLEDALAILKLMAKPGQKVVGQCCDVSKEKEVTSFISFALKELGGVDVLVNNAGVYGPKGLIEEVSSEEWTSAIQINLFGVMYFCKQIIPIMKKQGHGKIINLSGGGATNPLPRISAYAASKAAAVRFTETLAEECKGTNVFINAIAPGALNTGLLEEVLAAGPEKVGNEFYAKAVKQKETGGSSLENGAALCVYLASEESDGITGKLISAVWDAWKDLQSHADELEKTDIYTLRRIIPQDRGMDWDLKKLDGTKRAKKNSFS